MAVSLLVVLDVTGATYKKADGKEKSNNVGKWTDATAEFLLSQAYKQIQIICRCFSPD